jgi:hypothetical protein
LAPEGDLVRRPIDPASIPQNASRWQRYFYVGTGLFVRGAS